MSMIKRLIEENEAHRIAAVKIAEETGCIEICPHGTEIDTFGDVDDAVALGNEEWADRGFGSPQEAEEWIRRVIEQSGSECGAEGCSKD